MESGEDLESEAESEDSIPEVLSVEEWVLEEGDRLAYLCNCVGGETHIVDRSDLMDGGKSQRLVLRFERDAKMPWDAVCPVCGEEWECDECQCPEENCERPCRFMMGVNYGCEKHPVV